MGYYQAQDTFVAELEDGTMMRVARGDVLPDGHELVKRDQAATAALFSPLDSGEEDGAPAKRARPAAKRTATKAQS